MSETKFEAAVPAKRDLSLDALKAFLALGVIYMHTLIRFPEDSWPIHRPIFNALIIFVVPTFYFVSGLLFYPLIERINSFKTAGAIIGKRFSELLVPAIIFSLVPSFSRGIDLLIQFKTDFYFLDALFDIIVIMSMLSIAIFELTRRAKAFALIIFGLTTTVLLTLFHDSSMPGYFHWRQALHGNLFFIFGLLVGMFPRRIGAVLCSVTIMLPSFVLFLLCYYVVFEVPETISLQVSKIALRIAGPVAGIICIYGLFCRLSSHFSPNSLHGKTAYYLSTRSLPLYAMQDVVFALVFTIIDTSRIVEANVAGFVVFLLCVFLTLALHDLLCLNPLVEKIIFGRRKALLKPWDLLSIKPVFPKARNIFK